MTYDFQRDVDRLKDAPSVTNILDVVCRITGMRFAAVARVTEDRWIACSVKDEINFGLTPGGELQIKTTICDEIRQHGGTVVIDHVAADPSWAKHHTPLQYGFQSYISEPIRLPDGRFFGTLCAIDPEPHKLDTPEIRKMFALFSELIAYHLQSTDELRSTQTKLAEQQQAALLRDQFIAVLGHDLRNPLSAVDAGARMLQRQELTESQHSVLHLMRATTLRMQGLVNNVLDFARGKLGEGIILEPEHVDAIPLLHQVIQELLAATPDRVIETDFPGKAQVVCDPARIAQLFSNLVGNSLAHGDADTPIRISAKAAPKQFTLSVSNAAPPISAETQANLFTPFFRASGKNPHHGLGLGLFIAAEIARAHNGALEVASDDGQVRFTLTLPQDV